LSGNYGRHARKLLAGVLPVDGLPLALWSTGVRGDKDLGRVPETSNGYELEKFQFNTSIGRTS
jgi:hypothetical protein